MSRQGPPQDSGPGGTPRSPSAASPTGEKGRRLPPPAEGKPAAGLQAPARPQPRPPVPWRLRLEPVRARAALRVFRLRDAAARAALALPQRGRGGFLAGDRGEGRSVRAALSTPERGACPGHAAPALPGGSGNGPRHFRHSTDTFASTGEARALATERTGLERAFPFATGSACCAWRSGPAAEALALEGPVLTSAHSAEEMGAAGGSRTRTRRIPRWAGLSRPARRPRRFAGSDGAVRLPEKRERLRSAPWRSPWRAGLPEEEQPQESKRGPGVGLRASGRSSPPGRPLSQAGEPPPPSWALRAGLPPPPSAPGPAPV